MMIVDLVGRIQEGLVEMRKYHCSVARDKFSPLYAALATALFNYLYGNNDKKLKNGESEEDANEEVSIASTEKDVEKRRKKMSRIRNAVGKFGFSFEPSASSMEAEGFVFLFM
ncbi:MAG: hypothetical protein GY820_04710 [Gammaproteobacteria bacterium]|nr:hypothetical protein [Gammaproteobacteria bacterium]